MKLMKDELFNAQLLRALGYTAYGGADVGECLACADRITRTDADLWYDEWSALARRMHHAAGEAAARQDPVTASGAYLRASNYYRTSGVFLMQAPVEQRLRDSQARQVECFRAGMGYLPTRPDLLAIPYEDTSLPGYLFRSPRQGTESVEDPQRPLLILVNGYDGTAEELYFTSGAAALQHGYDVLAFDGPGQGRALLELGLVFRPDWENVVTPVVDYALTLPGVDPARLALMGLSFGGYLAPRAAAEEHRLAACISDCGPYDLFETSVSRLPGPLARQLPDGNRTALAALSRLLGFVMGRPTTGWALRRNLLVHGLKDPLAYFQMAPDYTMRGREHLITCPTLVCTAENDDLSERADQLYDALTCPKDFIRFTAAEGAGEHCESGARTVFNDRVLSWLDKTLPSPGA